MIKYLITIIFALFVCSTSIAQDAAKPEEQPKEIVLKEIVKPQAQLSKRIIFILDVSQSMTGNGQMKRMLDFVNGVCQQPLDEFEIAIIVFNTKETKWEGFPSPKEDPKPAPAGWAKLPSLDAVKAAQTWLSEFTGEGGTNPVSALKLALSENRADLSIILVTDGDFNGFSDINKRFLEVIKEGQEKREKDGLGRAVISIFGVGPSVTKQEHLKTVAKDEKGGFFIEEGTQKPDVR